MTRTAAKPWTIWITRIALGLAIALVIARATMTQQLRDPFQVSPGSQPAPRVLGPAGAVVLDLLMCFPAVLVLLRSSIDRNYLISFSRAHGYAFALAAWILISTFWATDRFAAAVEATHWGAAIVLLWSVAQLVDSWTRLRLVCAAAFGILLVLVAHGAIYRFVDVPDERQSFLQNEQQIYKDRGWDPDSFIAKQFKKKVMSGEIIGFSASPNTYAMMLVLLGLVSVGLAAQRFDDRDEWGWPTVILLAIPPALLMLWMTQCRAAIATPIIGMGLIFIAARWGDHRELPADWLAYMHRRVYFTGLAIVSLGAALLVGIGLTRGSLFHSSLTFRWRYWIGAARLFQQHWLSGVGFANFGRYYLSVRLPIASEEIQDPHNFIVRIAVETGSVGAILLLCWMLRLWWEMTLPRTIPESEDRPAPRPLGAALALATLGMLVNTVASVDFTQGSAWISLELLKRILWLGLLFAGIVIGVMRSSTRQVLDDRPAPWMLWAILGSLGVFLLHNTIEFGLFESGPLCVFALLVGATLGVRGVEWRAGARWGLTAIVFILWILMAAFWVAPVVYAEAHAQAGDDDLQANRPALAADEYSQAFAGLPLWNADYALKMARAQMYAGAPRDQVISSLDAAIFADDRLIQGYLTRAQYRMQDPTPAADRIRRDYETAITLNPNDVDVRTDYGAILEKLGFPHDAANAYRAALDKNAGLDPEEPKRLTAAQIDTLKSRIAALDSP
jgi:O-antigen ligase